MQVDYLSYQEKLKTHPGYRAWWVFWSNYSGLAIILISIFLFQSIQPITVRQVLFLIATALILRFVIISLIINRLFPRQRPYQILNFRPITAWFSKYTTKPTSFPSAHAGVVTVPFALFIFLYHFTQPWALLALFVSIVLTAIGRIILGYHYISDVIAGFILSLVISPFICLGLIKLIGLIGATSHI